MWPYAAIPPDIPHAYELAEFKVSSYIYEGMTTNEATALIPTGSGIVTLKRTEQKQNKTKTTPFFHLGMRGSA